MLWQYYLAPAALCAPVLADPLLTVLKDNGFTLFADHLEGHPVLDVKHELIVYATTNDALPETGDGAGAGTVQPRATEEDERQAKNGIHSVNASGTKPPRPGSNPGNNTRLARDVGPGGSEQVTLLDNPEFVNLGPGRTQIVVERTTPHHERPLVFSGLGKNVSVTADDIPFDNGVIRPVDGLLTLPATVSATLPALGLNKFHSLAQKAGLLDELDAKPGLTILAPRDEALAGSEHWSGDQLAARLRQHVLVDYQAYSPQLEDGALYPTLAGGHVRVEVRDGLVYLGGARIQQGNSITINGLVHAIDSVLLEESSPPPLPAGTTTLRESLSLGALAYGLAGMTVGAQYFGLM